MRTLRFTGGGERIKLPLKTAGKGDMMSESSGYNSSVFRKLENIEQLQEIVGKGLMNISLQE